MMTEQERYEKRMQQFVEQIISVMQTQIEINDEIDKRIRNVEKYIMGKNHVPKTNTRLRFTRSVDRIIKEFGSG